MNRDEFEPLLDKATATLSEDVRKDTKYHKPDDFQRHVFDVLTAVTDAEKSIRVKPTFHPHAFPDIHANGFGVEVKSTNKDSWLSVGNSVFEGMRDPEVKEIYVVFGKMGGMPAVRWGRYEERITHVRISHAPRFVLEMDRDSSLFTKLNVSYDEFAGLPPTEKMRHIRKYSRERLKGGERLWWLEDEGNQGLPLEIQLYVDLPQREKRRLRAEAALLFPGIVGHSRSDKYKYVDAAFFLLKYRNVFCHQTRDLFGAGSVAGTARGGNYVLRALEKIQDEMREAAQNLDDALFVEYWNESVPASERISKWLARADAHATGWRPSDHLFKN